MALPDLFTFTDGRKVKNFEDWQKRRIELRNIMLDNIYGQLPPKPEKMAFEMLHTSRGKEFKRSQCRIVSEFPHGNVQFILEMFIPYNSETPFEVILCGDGCWGYMNDEVIREIVKRGRILARFNRTEIADDNDENKKDTAIYKACPGDYGAIAGWAWGYHRAVDFLSEQNYVDASKIAIIGHSRGGKATLLAGATDERIAITGSNNSGCGGAGSFRYRPPEAEEIKLILDRVPSWFNSKAMSYYQKDSQIPFDQHWLKALCAPRAFISFEALGDRSSNPSGTLLTHLAAREAYKFLGIEDKIGIVFREGVHEHNLNDWKALLDFMDWQLRGLPQMRDFNSNPFPELTDKFNEMITKA